MEIKQEIAKYQETRNHEIFGGLSFIKGARHQFGQNHLISWGEHPSKDLNSPLEPNYQEITIAQQILKSVEYLFPFYKTGFYKNKNKIGDSPGRCSVAVMTVD